MSVQICKTCQTEKPLSEFYFRKDNGSYRKECKQCHNVRTQAWANDNRDKSNAIKRCYEIRNKELVAAKRSAYKKANRDIINIQQRAWRKANPDRNKAYSRDAYWRNPELARQRASRWYHQNRDYALQLASEYNKRPEVRKRLSVYRKNKMRNDPAYAINHRMRARIRDSIKTVDPKAGRSWLSFVDFTPSQLRKQLENQFTKGMSWENMHLWEIDHIVPLALFDIKEVGDADFRAAWCLGNLRPLWRTENRSKGAKRMFLI